MPLKNHNSNSKKFATYFLKWLSISGLYIFLPALALADGETPVSDGLSYIATAMFGDTGIAIATVAVIGIGLLCLCHVLEWKRFFQTLAGISIIFGAAGIVSALHGLIST